MAVNNQWGGDHGNCDSPNHEKQIEITAKEMFPKKNIWHFQERNNSNFFYASDYNQIPSFSPLNEKMERSQNPPKKLSKARFPPWTWPETGGEIPSLLQTKPDLTQTPDLEQPGFFHQVCLRKLGTCKSRIVIIFPKFPDWNSQHLGLKSSIKTGTTATDQTVAIHTLHPSAVFSPALRIKFLSRSWAVLNLTMNRSPLKSKIAVKSPNWRFIARKIKYPWKIYHCQVLLPRGSGISTFVWGGSSCS